MCPVEEITSCQLSFLPIQSSDYAVEVERVLEIISSYRDLESDVGLMSTTIRGGRDRILSLIREIFDTMRHHCYFSLDVRLSNLCGCQAEKE